MISTAALVLATLVGMGPLQDPVSVDSATERVIASERAWSDAVIRHDPRAISRLLADDFVGIDGRGVVTDKAAELAEAKPQSPGANSPILVSEQLSEIRVRKYADTAILTAVNTAHFSDSTVRYRRTTVWVRRGDEWRCVSFHGSRILE
jgi:ketosteroid isomerase-like protein